MALLCRDNWAILPEFQKLIEEMALSATQNTVKYLIRKHPRAGHFCALRLLGSTLVMVEGEVLEKRREHPPKLC